MSGIELSLAYQSSDTLQQSGIIQLLDDLRRPHAIDATSFGQVFLVEGGKSRLLVVDTTGTRQDSVGNLGLGDYQFDQPVDVDATNGLRIYIADEGNRRIQVFDRRLQFLTSIQANGSSSEYPYQPIKLTSNAFREVYFFNGTTQRIVKINERGEEVTAFGLHGAAFEQTPLDIESSEEWLYVLDNSGKQLHTFSTGGSYIKFWVLRDPAFAVKIHQNHIWTLHSDGLQQRSMNGRVVKSYSFSIAENPIDFAINDTTVFILTETGLSKFYW